MIKIKRTDLQLAMEHLNGNCVSEWVEIDSYEAGGAAISLEFIDLQGKNCKILLYVSDKNITPEIRLTSKLYKKEK
ncbi:MAG: hypothetical protein HC836_46610 [Richelia sp. RM2_1_2]|nr:hypothetical protein [Richelia sp. RM2_1_2]